MFLRSLVVSILSASTLAAQATIHVPGDVPTIQGAIVLAVDGDTVRVAPGTYLEILDYLGKAITVESEAGASTTTIDAQAFNPVVAFENGEGPGSVLRGFTVTGGMAGGNNAGIHCPDASPRVQRCIIRDNTSFGGTAGGLYGNATLEDCVIEDNIGGGVAGSPVLLRCLLRGNTAYDGAAMRLYGGRAEDCVIVANSAAEGSSGGAVAIEGSGVVLERCVIARNGKGTGGGAYAARGAGVFAGPTTNPSLVNCTIVANVIPEPAFHGGDVGGVYGQAVLVNCIVRDNDALELDGGASATWSDVEGGAPGLGNFDLPALLADVPNDDYRLLPGSPCIDTGDPTAPLDLDGTRADVGAIAFTHATATPYNGTGVNPFLFGSPTLPAIGTTWILRILPSSVPGATLSGIVMRGGALPGGLPSPYGEILVSGPRFFATARASTGTVDDFAFPLPADANLLGLQLFAQAYVRSPTVTRLGNALRVLIGN